MDKYKYARLMSRDRNLTPAECRLLLYLWDFADSKTLGSIRPGRARMESESTLSRNKIQAALSKLVGDGYLVVVAEGGRFKGGRGQATVYRLGTPKAWLSPPLSGDHPPTEWGGLDPESPPLSGDHPVDNPRGLPASDEHGPHSVTRKVPTQCAERGPLSGDPTDHEPTTSTDHRPTALTASGERPSTQAMYQLPEQVQEQAVDLIQAIARMPGINDLTNADAERLATLEADFAGLLLDHVSDDAADLFEAGEWTIPHKALTPSLARAWLGKFMNTMRRDGHFTIHQPAATAAVTETRSTR